MRLQLLNRALNGSIRVLKRLVRPSDQLQEPYSRRQAETLAGLQIIALPLGLLIMIVELFLNPSYIYVFPILMPSFLMGFVHYFLARSQYARLGCWIQVLNTWSILVLGPHLFPEYQYALWFLVLPILFAHVLLGAVQAVYMGLGSLVFITFYDVGILANVDVIWMQYAFIILVTSALVLSGFQRNLVARDFARQADIRERRQRQLLNATFDGTVILCDGQILEANEAFAALVGIPRHQLVGKDIRDYIETLEVSVNSANVGFGMERVLLRRSDGDIVRAEQLLTEFSDEEQELQLVAIRDISNELLLQNQLQHSRRMASVGHMAATVAHEINNPLAVIQLRLDLVRSNTAKTDAENHLAVVSEHVQRITHIVRNMRSFSKPSKMLWQPLPLSHVVTTALGIVNGSSTTPLEVRFHARPSDLTVWGVSEDVEQAFVNIFLYLRESLSTESTVTVRGFSEGDWVKIFIRCQEEAMDVMGLKGLFSATPQQLMELSGTAIGLSIAWGILHEYEGVLHASPGPHGRGQIELSMRRFQGANPTSLKSVSKSRKRTILLVEDEPVLNEALTTFLVKEEFDVFDARTMREAMVLLENQDIDGILSDYHLQDNTIDSLLDHIKGHLPELLGQTVLISGHTNFDSRNLPVLLKPFSLSQLGSIISQWQLLDS